MALGGILAFIIGTPLVISTVGHGSGFEVAGKGTANPSPRIETLRLIAQRSPNTP